MKLTLSEPKTFKESIAILSDLVTETTITVTQENLEIIAMDPANVAMVIFKLSKNNFAEYEVKEEKESISVNLTNLKQILRRLKTKDILTLEASENKLKITMKAKNTRTFNIPLIELENENQKIPDLNFETTIQLPSATLNDSIDDVDIVGESVTFHSLDNTLNISSSGDLTNANVRLNPDDEIDINSNSEQKSKYSTEYLKKMIQGSKITDKTNIKFSSNYPLRLEYHAEGASLEFILAPRVDND